MQWLLCNSALQSIPQDLRLGQVAHRYHAGVGSTAQRNARCSSIAGFEVEPRSLARTQVVHADPLAMSLASYR